MKHNFPKDITVVCTLKHNLKQAKEIFHLAIDGDCPIYQKTLENPVDKKYLYFRYDGENIHLTARTKEAYPDELYVTFDEFKAFLQGKGKYKAPFKQEIKISDSYTAVITKQNVKVGCQILSHKLVEEIYLSSQKALKS